MLSDCTSRSIDKLWRLHNLGVSDDVNLIDGGRGV